MGGGWNDKENKNNRKTPPSFDFGEWDKIPLELSKLAKEWYRILKDNGTLICFYDIWKIQELKEELEKAKFKQPRLLRWDKTNPIPINSKLNYLTNSSEYFVSFVKKGKPTFNSEYDKGIYNYPICSGKERTIHPTQKPEILIKELIKKHSKKGDLVLDCFMGSGTTGVACKELERDFIGVEINKEFFDIAVERINSVGKTEQIGIENLIGE